MTLPQSGQPISASQINVELGKASNATFSINATDSRTLAGITTPGSTIKYSDFHGKSSMTGNGQVSAYASYDKEPGGPNGSDSDNRNLVISFTPTSSLTNATLHLNISTSGMYSTINGTASGSLHIEDNLGSVLFSDPIPSDLTDYTATRLYSNVNLSTFTLTLTVSAACSTSAPTQTAASVIADVSAYVTAWFTT